MFIGLVKFMLPFAFASTGPSAVESVFATPNMFSSMLVKLVENNE